MGTVQRLLLLAGSAEARQIALACRAQGIAVDAVMSEPPRGMTPMPVAYDVLEAVTVEALAARMAGVDAVVDASHGFDAALTDAGFEAAKTAEVPIVSLSRPEWEIAGQEGWQTARDVARAMHIISPGARVFAATGWVSLPAMAAFPGDALLLRQTERHSKVPPYDFVQLVFGEAPFSVEDEMALFARLAVDTLMCRNLGGVPSRPKLDAAARLGVGVILIDRPAKPDGLQIVTTADQVMDWVAGL